MTAGLILGLNFVRDSDCDCVSYLDIPLSMQPNCEQIRQISCLKIGMNLLVIFLDIMPMCLRRDNLNSMKYQPF